MRVYEVPKICVQMHARKVLLPIGMKRYKAGRAQSRPMCTRSDGWMDGACVGLSCKALLLSGLRQDGPTTKHENR